GAMGLLVFSAWRDAVIYRATGRPVNGASVLAFLWLADAQLLMILAPPWTIAWWTYHGLMLGAVVIALSAELVELDRLRDLQRFLAPSVVDRVLSGETPTLVGQRREITILFADLRDSTALAETLEPEEMAQLLNDFLGAVAGEIARFEGTVDKYLGDGLMAFFGDRPGQNDHTERAVRAALAMQQRMRELDSRWQMEGREPLGMGIGIATGVAIVGSTGSANRMDYTAIGTPVNIASRLTSLADAGQVLTTRKTYWRVIREVHGVARPPTVVKGFSQPLEVMQLVGLRAVPQDEEGAAPSPFMQTMTRALADPAYRASLLHQQRPVQGGLSAQERELIGEIGSLMECPLFAGVSGEEVASFVAVATVKSYDRGTIVVRQAAREDELYVLLQGNVEVVGQEPSGRERVLATLTRGEIFGEISLLFDTERTASVRATAPVKLLALHREDCYSVLSRTPTLRA